MRLVIITIHTCASIGAQPHKGAHGQYGRGHDDRRPSPSPPHAPDAALHPRRAAGVHGGARRFACRVPALRVRHGPGERSWVLDLTEGGERAGAAADGARLLGALHVRTPRPRSGHAASAAVRAAPGIVGHATDSAVGVGLFRLVRAAFRGAGAAGRDGRELAVPGPVIDPRPPRRPAHRVRRAGRPAGGGSRGRNDRALTERSRTRSPTAWPSSSRPRRWARYAVSGGRPDSDRLLCRAWTTRRCAAGGSPIRRIRRGSHSRWAYPAAGTANADVRSLRDRP